MKQVIIALGSDTRQSVHIQWASQQLSCSLENFRLSRRLWTQDIRGNGRMYMNQLAIGYTHLALDELELLLKQLERKAGRTRDHVNIDLDLMLFGSQRFHLKDWPRPYIQQLLPDILCND